MATDMYKKKGYKINILQSSGDFSVLLYDSENKMASADKVMLRLQILLLNKN
jgi:hypothetical protein